MKKRILTGSIFILASHCVFSSQSEVDWVGNYHYYESIDMPDYSMDWDYRLSIAQNGSCELTVDGYMTSIEVDCQISQSPTSLDIKVLRQSESCHPCNYQPEEILLTLFYKNKTLMTQWKNLTPNIEGESLLGKYFEKSKEL